MKKDDIKDSFFDKMKDNSCVLKIKLRSLLIVNFLSPLLSYCENLKIKQLKSI
jgi:hypothetical protein